MSRAVDDAWAWLAEDGPRTRRWLLGERERVASFAPATSIQDLAGQIEDAMTGRQSVRVPVVVGQWCVRHDASSGWSRSLTPLGGGRWGPWQPISFGVPDLDRAMSADVRARPQCPDDDQSTRAAITVTQRGADSSISVEVDLDRCSPVPEGLSVPSHVHQVSWDGPDAWLVSYLERRGSGRRWVVDRIQRGNRWSDAQRVHAFPEKLVAGAVTRDQTSVLPRYLMVEWLDHRRRRYSLSSHVDAASAWSPLALPAHVRAQLMDDLVILIPLRPWALQNLDSPVTPGSVLAAPVVDVVANRAAPRTLYEPAPGEKLLNLAAGSRYLALGLRDDSTTRLVLLDPQGSDITEIAHCDVATNIRSRAVNTTSSCSHAFWVESSGPVTPATLAMVEAGVGSPSYRVLETAAASFRHQDFNVQSLRVPVPSAPSVDLTLVAPRDCTNDGSNPTLLPGYGAFGVAPDLDYLDLTGLTWLDRAGPSGRRNTYAFAHVGAGLSGYEPWERLSICVRQFLSVAHHLVASGWTKPEHLGALGVSHGGALVMNAVLDDPSVFAAIVCRSAVLDVVGFPQLDGTAWVTEYGDPREPATRRHLVKLSPFHRIARGGSCPPVLLWSADNDDRVSPAHSRRFAARARATGIDAHYLETVGGGHDQLATTPVGAGGLAIVSDFLRHHLTT